VPIRHNCRSNTMLPMLVPIHNRRPNISLYDHAGTICRNGKAANPNRSYFHTAILLQLIANVLRCKVTRSVSFRTAARPNRVHQCRTIYRKAAGNHKYNRKSVQEDQWFLRKFLCSRGTSHTFYSQVVF